MDRMPPCPTSTRAKPWPAAMRSTVRMASRLWKRPSPPSTRVWPPKPSGGRTASNTDCTKLARYVPWANTATFLRRPLVPGFMPGMGVVGMRCSAMRVSSVRVVCNKRTRWR